MSKEENASQAAAAKTVTFTQSAGLMPLLRKLKIALAFTSYQSGLLYLLSHRGGSGHIHQCAIPRPMGLARAEGGFVLSAGRQVIRFASPLASHERVNDLFDACFVPRAQFITGELDAHDVGIDADGEFIFVNTRFNCLARPDPRHSFREVWRPHFISELVDQDRCHLNGLAMRDGKPAYVTAASKSDTVDGWRDRRASGGVVIDVAENRVVCEGLSMPHSPRWHNGELWVLNSGTGELGVVEGLESGMGRFVPRVFCPGFVRGLAFHGRYAFVGLSKPRYQRFEGLALDERLQAADSEPWCGIQIIDLERNVCAEWFRIDGAVAELYDVEVLPGIACALALAPDSPELTGFVTWEGRLPAPAPAPLDLGEELAIEGPPADAAEPEATATSDPGAEEPAEPAGAT